MKNLFCIGVCVMGLTLVGCRGTISDDTPIHLNPNMDFQEKYEAQEANAFFADGRAMRPPVPGTVARGFLREDAPFYYGRNEDGSYVADVPIPITRDVILRGRERYNIYCTPCHGRSGDGQGIIMTGDYGFVPAPTYHAPRLRDIEDGYLYDVIANGFGTMAGYGQQITVADRWAITIYIRALQRSQNAAEGDVPPGMLADLQQGRATN